MFYHRFVVCTHTHANIHSLINLCDFNYWKFCCPFCSSTIILFFSFVCDSLCCRNVLTDRTKYLYHIHHWHAWAAAVMSENDGNSNFSKTSKTADRKMRELVDRSGEQLSRKSISAGGDKLKPFHTHDALRCLADACHLQRKSPEVFGSATFQPFIKELIVNEHETNQKWSASLLHWNEKPLNSIDISMEKIIIDSFARTFVLATITSVKQHLTNSLSVLARLDSNSKMTNSLQDQRCENGSSIRSVNNSVFESHSRSHWRWPDDVSVKAFTFVDFPPKNHFWRRTYFSYRQLAIRHAELQLALCVQYAQNV